MKTEKLKIMHACKSKTEVGTSGYQSKDSKCDGEICYKFIWDGNFEVDFLKNKDDEIKGFELTGKGDSEILNLYESLKFAVEVLESKTLL